MEWEIPTIFFWSGLFPPTPSEGRISYLSCWTGGSAPFFTHIERYEYFFRNEENLEYFRNLGCLFQVNADTVLNPKQQSQVFHLIRDGYLHIVASDAHNTGGRPSNLKKAMDCISEHLGDERARWLNENANQIFHDRDVKILTREDVNSKKNRD